MMQNFPMGIAINKAANGFIVTLPVPNSSLQALHEQNLKRQIEVQNEVLQPKSEIEQLQQAGGNDKQQNVNLNIGKLDVMQNVFIFKEWSEVLDFLADEVE